MVARAFCNIGLQQQQQRATAGVANTFPTPSIALLYQVVAANANANQHCLCDQCRIFQITS